MFAHKKDACLFASRFIGGVQRMMHGTDNLSTRLGSQLDGEISGASKQPDRRLGKHDELVTNANIEGPLRIPESG